MFTKRSWESFYSGLIMVGLVFMSVPGYLFLRCDKGEADHAAAYHVSARSGDLRD